MAVNSKEITLDIDTAHKTKAAMPAEGDLFELPGNAEHVADDTIVIERYTLQVAGVAQKLCCTTLSSGQRVCWNC